MPSQTAAVRSFLGGLIDKFAAWQLGLPPETCSYTIRSLKIPLEDGVKLAADLYIPIKQKPFGTLFVPTPYGVGAAASLTQVRVFAARGYTVLTSSCRGTFESEGDFEPFRNEAKDGHTIVAWMREQDWYTGSFATLGGSYLGYNQWALLSDPPEDMKAAVIRTGLHSMSDFVWGAGALQSHVIEWEDIQRRVGKAGLFSVIMHLRSLKKTMRPVYDSVPLLDSVNSYFQGKTPQWLQDSLTHSDKDDAYWAPMDQSGSVEKANIPILLTSGWEDAILSNVMWQYQRLSGRGCKVALTVGPWTHLGCQSRNTIPESFNWLEEHLAQRSSGSRTSPVRIFVTGAKDWRDLPRWPSATSAFELYLSSDRQLVRETPPIDTLPSIFDFDPAHATPSVGCPLIFDNGPGRSEGDTALASRSDVLVFDTGVLKNDIEVCGKPTIELQHSTSHPDADLLVLLSEVNEKGNFSRTISEKFCKGTKIRLMIAGGSHPRYIRNMGTGEDPVRSSKMQVVQHIVRHDASAVSKLILPVTEPPNIVPR